jgi:hypothetical protein
MSDLQYHYSASAPSAQLAHDLLALNDFAEEELRALLPVVLSFLAQHTSQETLLAEFVGAHPALKSRYVDSCTRAPDGSARCTTVAHGLIPLLHRCRVLLAL